MKDIVQTENPVLRDIAKDVALDEIQSKALQQVLKDMSEALSTQHDGVAIAAPQIGVSLRIFVVSGIVFTADGEERANDMVFINPEVKKLSRRKDDMDEGCLSVRWKYGKVLRHEKATVTAYDETGKIFTYNGSGLLAQIFQHETDHLKGILFTDKATEVRDLPDDEVEKIQEKNKLHSEKND